MLVRVKTQDDLWGKKGIITQINKALLERILNAEIDFHLDSTHQERSTKTAILEEAIAKGMTVRDIQTTLQDLYHVEVSPTMISKVTDVVKEEVEQWRDRPLEAVYPVVWLDGIVVKGSS